MVEPLIIAEHRPDQFEILAAVRRAGKSLSQIARDAGLPLSCCTGAIARGDRPAGEFAIAEFLEVHPAALWPERYRNPTPKRLRYLEANHSRIQRWAKCLKSRGD